MILCEQLGRFSAHFQYAFQPRFVTMSAKLNDEIDRASHIALNVFPANHGVGLHDQEHEVINRAFGVVGLTSPPTSIGIKG